MEPFAKDLRNTVFAALMAALVIAGSYMAIPIGPVPITLQSMFVLLSGLLLGKFWGSMALAGYLIAGIVGLPVFAHGKGGLAVLFGPTGGFLISFVVAAFITGMISEKSLKLFAGNRSKIIIFDIIALIFGSVVIFTLGVSWFKFITGHGWEQSLGWTLYPFIPGAIVKLIAAAVIAQLVRPIIYKQQNQL
ncbi:MAG: biotin transporter BioY [Deltaproteobacteria bacterium]|jgi:biotin transport system substrate-specific component|nr:biotin transporter BioY [Deltaproteobacteria bacterium]